MALDDDPIALRLIKKEFKLDEDKFDIKVYQSPKSFMNDFTSDVDLVVLDLNIPYEEYEINKILREMYKINLYVLPILLTASVDKDIVIDLLNLKKIRSYIDKSSNDWLSKLRKFIEIEIPVIKEVRRFKQLQNLN